MARVQNNSGVFVSSKLIIQTKKPWATNPKLQQKAEKSLTMKKLLYLQENSSVSLTKMQMQEEKEASKGVKIMCFKYIKPIHIKFNCPIEKS